MVSEVNDLREAFEYRDQLINEGVVGQLGVAGETRTVAGKQLEIAGASNAVAGVAGPVQLGGTYVPLYFVPVPPSALMFPVRNKYQHRPAGGMGGNSVGT